MTRENSNLLKSHKIKKGEQVPLHVTNKQLRDLPLREKSKAEKVYDTMPLDEKIKAKQGKLSKPKKVVS